jgi:predicted  nucleic acid-binding Zn-ribbon protein
VSTMQRQGGEQPDLEIKVIELEQRVESLESLGTKGLPALRLQALKLEMGHVKEELKELRTVLRDGLNEVRSDLREVARDLRSSVKESTRVFLYVTVPLGFLLVIIQGYAALRP